jgi:hypothetical protein
MITRGKLRTSKTRKQFFFEKKNQKTFVRWHLATLAPSGTRVAWFKDPDGSLLSASDHPANAPSP